jgi:hypothetical protein
MSRTNIFGAICKMRQARDNRSTVGRTEEGRDVGGGDSGEVDKHGLRAG